jgi:hypothetical protein
MIDLLDIASEHNLCTLAGTSDNCLDHHKITVSPRCGERTIRQMSPFVENLIQSGAVPLISAYR